VERDTRGFCRSFVAYDRLLSDWCNVVDRIGRDLAIPWPRRSVAFDLEIDFFLSKRHRHHWFGDETPLAPRKTAQMLKTAFDWAMGAVDGCPSAPAELDAVYAGLPTANRAVPVGGRIKHAHTSFGRGAARVRNPVPCISSRGVYNRVMRPPL
jgi:hypothetical protein